MKKIIIAFVVLIILGIASFFIFSLDNRVKNNIESSGISAIPYSSAAILRLNKPVEKWSELLNTTYGKQLSLIPQVQNLNSQISEIEKHIKNEAVFNKCYKKGDIYLSLHMTGIQSYNYLLVANCDFTKKEAFLEAISKSLKSTKKNTRNYEECELITIDFGTTKSSVSIAFENNLVMISTSPILLENSVLQLKRRTSLADKSEFSKLFKTADESLDANLFINYKELSNFVNVFSNENAKKGLSYFGDWMEVDLKISDKGLLFNGFSFMKDSSASFLSNLQGLSPGKMNVAAIVPDNVAFMSFLGFDNFKAYEKNFKIH